MIFWGVVPFVLVLLIFQLSHNVRIPIFRGPIHTKTELFCSVFKKICVHTFSPVHTRTPHSSWKRFYTISAHAQMNSTHAHFNISAHEIGAKLKPNGSIYQPFWILTIAWSGTRSCLYWFNASRFQIASFSPSTLENSVFKKHRFQIAPLWRPFSNGSVFGDRL